MKFRIRQVEYDAFQLGVRPEEDDRILKRCHGSMTSSHIEGNRYYVHAQGGRTLMMKAGDWVIERTNGDYQYLDDVTFHQQYERVPDAPAVKQMVVEGPKAEPAKPVPTVTPTGQLSNINTMTKEPTK